MRPRVFPAEDPLPIGLPLLLEISASMRPRVFPAEDRETGSVDARSGLASMRPRVFPAEDIRPEHRPIGPRERFNEAAGIPRGRLPPAVPVLADCVGASMRPRVFPAEDAS